MKQLIHLPFEFKYTHNTKKYKNKIMLKQQNFYRVLCLKQSERNVYNNEVL